jgi:hypothetical protein
MRPIERLLHRLGNSRHQAKKPDYSSFSAWDIRRQPPSLQAVMVGCRNLGVESPPILKARVALQRVDGHVIEQADEATLAQVNRRSEVLQAHRPQRCLMQMRKGVIPEEG